MSATRRRNIADEMDAIDGQIWDLQQAKKDAYGSYREALKAEGLRDHDIKLEVEALKKAIARRRKLIEKPGEVEETDAKVDEIVADLMTKPKPGTRLATHARPARAETPYDPTTGEVLGDAPPPAGEILTQDGTRFAAAEMNATEQQKAEAAARGFPMPAAQPSASTPLRTLPPRVPEPAPEMPDLPAFLDRRNERAEAAAE